MIELKPDTFSLLTRSINLDTYNQNIGVLSNTKYIQNLYKSSHFRNFDEFLHSTENVPRALESYLVIDFERKRTLICEFLFTIHFEYPRIFTLEKYLHTTRRVFGLVTQYKWSREDISFVLKTIIIYLDIHIKDIPRESVLILMKKFGGYGPWKDSELKKFIDYQYSIGLLQKNIKQRILKKIKTVRSLRFTRFKRILMKFSCIRKMMMLKISP